MDISGLLSDLTLRPLSDLGAGAWQLERRTEFLWRDQFDRVLLPPAFAALQALINAGRSNELLGLAEEQELPDEERLTRELIDEIAKFIRQTWQPGAAQRFGNTKTYGVVRGEFSVLPDLPKHLRHGIFAKPATYRAWVRFSGPGPYAPPDIEDFGQTSIGIKLLGVPGPRLLEDERATQDLIMANPVTCVSPNARENVKLQRHVRAGTPLVHIINPFDSHLLAFAMQFLYTRVHSSPLETQYYSQVPYLLGEGQAVQYSLKPRSPAKTKIPARPSPNYLREAMARTLEDGDWRFGFMVQVQTDAHLMPIEDATVKWPERLSPYVPVGELRLPAQSFDSDEQLAFADNLRYNPWHSLAAHKPLGSVNRVRKRVYHEMAKLRQAMNQAPHVEPTGDESFPGSSPLSRNGRRKAREVADRAHAGQEEVAAATYADE